MKSITNYMDELKEKLGSDYQAALLMEVDRSVISQIRKRGAISDENAVKVAALLGIKADEILLAAAVARSSGAVREAWLAIAEKGGVAASIGLLCVLIDLEATKCILC